MGVIWWSYGVAIGKRAGWGRPVGRAAWRLRRCISSWQRSLEAQGLAGRILASSATAAEQTNRNAGFIRQAGEWDWGGRMNPAFRWCCQDPTAANPICKILFHSRQRRAMLQCRHIE